jgi:5-methylcytosine-specific restriction protein A
LHLPVQRSASGKFISAWARGNLSGLTLSAGCRGAEAVKEALGEVGAGLLVEGSAGAGNWAVVPWISVFDPAITTTTTEGYYVVYLFHGREPVVHLSLNQGTTSVRKEFGARTREILQDRAELMRKRVAQFADAPSGKKD